MRALIAEHGRPALSPIREAAMQSPVMNRSQSKRARCEEETTERLEWSRAVLSRRPGPTGVKPSPDLVSPQVVSSPPNSGPPTVELSPACRQQQPFLHHQEITPLKSLPSPAEARSLAVEVRGAEGGDGSPSPECAAPPCLGRSESVLNAAAALFDASQRAVSEAADTGNCRMAVSGATTLQLQLLAAAFRLRPEPTAHDLSTISRCLDIPIAKLESWFSSRRTLQEWVAQSHLQPADLAKMFYSADGTCYPASQA